MIKQKYEIMFILEAVDYAKIKEEVKPLLENNECEIEEEEELGIKTLGYPIKKQEKGFYYLLHIMANPTSLKGLYRDIRLNERILKYMCIAYNKNKIKSRQYRRPLRPTPPAKYEQDRKEQRQNTDSHKEPGEVTIDNKE